MNKSQKRALLIYLALFAFLSLVIAAGLPELSFNPGLPPPEPGSAAGGPAHTAGRTPAYVEKTVVPKSIAATLCGVIGLTVLIVILKKTNFRELKSVLKSLVPVLLIIAGLAGLYAWLMSDEAPRVIRAAPPALTPAPARTAAPAGEVPAIFLGAAALVIAGISGALLVRLILSKKKKAALPEAIAHESLKAKRAIELGENLKEVIIRYYQKLCEILADEQALEREAFATVEEFERTLAEAGAPARPVRDLTRLFEAARYGRWDPPPGSGEAALSSLEDIIRYFRAAGERAIHEKT